MSLCPQKYFHIFCKTHLSLAEQEKAANVSQPKRMRLRDVEHTKSAALDSARIIAL